MCTLAPTRPRLISSNDVIDVCCIAKSRISVSTDAFQMTNDFYTSQIYQT